MKIIIVTLICFSFVVLTVQFKQNENLKRILVSGSPQTNIKSLIPVLIQESLLEKVIQKRISYTNTSKCPLVWL